jgi:3-methyladenine DNA glycosylase AlkC
MNYEQKLDAALNPKEILQLPASDEDFYVRVRVARNPNASVEILKKLATDEKSYVRYWVAQNPNRNELIERLVFMTNYQQEIGP